ncbi:hypothetical protein SAE01_43110 [Segetibacter aerophilus]|uniref:DUF2905 domain-containing protein n=2 Tax=Segetibacter aerophilus TaxID=670293 RepID=A0A512BIW4_9BACT|nr:hypothetical protein SAE01_43110 [Segetibacter aerophilus]
MGSEDYFPILKIQLKLVQTYLCVMNQQSGKYIIFFGAAIVIIGLIIYLFPNAFKWFGRLPGDVRIDKGNVKVFFPIVTMILLSLLLTLILNIFKRF